MSQTLAEGWAAVRPRRSNARTRRLEQRPPRPDTRSRRHTDDDRRGARRSALAEQADALRRLHAGPRPLVLPNAWDVASARLVAKDGFPVVATSSGAIAATLGYEDNDSMPVDEAFSAIARITRSVSVP